jgi:hypothetical protein
MLRPERAVALVMMASAACASQSLAADSDIRDQDIRSVTGGPAHAQPFDAIPTASPDVLAALRGGFRVGALDMEFAANVRTLVDGNLVLESTVNLAPGGTTVTQTGTPAAGTLTFANGQGNTNVLPANLSGLAGQSGVVMEQSSGVTAAFHSVTREQILGVLFTTASNQQIRQEVNVAVTIANFGRFQDAARSALFSGRLVGSFGPVN